MIDQYVCTVRWRNLYDGMEKYTAILCIVMLFCGMLCTCVPVYAQQVDFWSDETNRATAYALRDDAAKRIEIADAAQLALFAHEVNQGTSFAGYTVVLTQDIDLSGHF